MTIDFDKCACNDKQPALICFACWKRGVRPENRLEKYTEPMVFSVPPVVEVTPIDAKLLRYKAAGILDCTCGRLLTTDGKSKCPTHGEFYGTKS